MKCEKWCMYMEGFYKGFLFINIVSEVINNKFDSFLEWLKFNFFLKY